MENKKLIEVKFQELSLEVQKDDTYEWLLDTESVAQGYGVAVSTIRDHKNNKNELLEGIHFLSVGISDAQKMGLKFTNKTRKKTYWTKRGVINLGFHIKSERAIKFRYWAEDLILGLEKSNQDLALKDYFDSKFLKLKTDLKDYVDKKIRN